MSQQPHTPNAPDDLESLLSAATRWDQEPMDLWSRALVPAPRTTEPRPVRRGRLRRSAGVIGLLMLLGIGGAALVATIENTDQA